ncbi:MAG: Gldg family protein, partial [Tepidisphaeraceae bacterium]
MSETKNQQPVPPESQKQRWVKYGANVALVTIVVIVLAVVATALAQRANRRLDTTAAGLYSLKPQTVNIIKDNKSKIKLVSLYTRNTTAPGQQPTDDVDYAQVVDDLLDEYARKGKNIEVESIDPIANPSKVDDLINEVTNKYGGEVAKYKEVIDAYPAAYDKIQKLTGEQVKKVAELSMDNLGGDDAQGVSLAIATVQQFPDVLKSSEKTIQRRLELKPPDYKGATSSVERTMDTLAQMTGKIVDDFNKGKDNPKLPENLRQYMTASAGTYAEIKRIADEQVAKIKALGELKLDDLRQKLREQNAILVMGEKDMRSLSADQVWKRNDDELRRLRPGDEVQAKAKFAGEQQITTAILALTQEKKPKVVFVRPGGGPLTSAGFPPFQPSGPLSKVADRLREYNFEVLEKDLSGTWAMQQQMRQQQMPSEPEPSDEEIKDAVWIVLSIPTGGGPMGPPQPIAPKVAEHLKRGGSALMLFYPQGDDLHEALAEWGITVESRAIAVHEAVPSRGGPSGDMIEDAQRFPFIFVTNNYGDHPITRPLQSLDALLLHMMPITTKETKGYKTTPLLPLPQGAWGER